MHGTAPAYLADSLRPTSEFVARCYLRSADRTMLLVPPTRRVTLGDRAFCGGCSAGVEQSASIDQGCLSAVVFLAPDKGPSVSVVVQLTSDYCLPSLFFYI